MKVVRVYSSLMEAQLAKIQLRDAGIGCDLPDEAAAGNFPAAAFADGVRLLVDDADEERAREVLGLPEREARLPSAAPRKAGVPVWMFVIIALALIALAIRSDQTPKGGRDGVMTKDRNHDGKDDWRQETSDHGATVTIYTDNNFDGVWDHRANYSGKELIWSETDSDFDGSYDWKNEYKNGVIVSAVCRKGGVGPELVRETFKHGILVSELVDEDGDGKWDYQKEFDPYGRETAKIPLK
ncbi:MAG: hypothetical protein JWO82_3394 [Akkermansiaceae bacterium]|nr:hypothetical protein [Akkermansiaceae bacterium]